SSFAVNGTDCFDINRSDIQGRPKADFNASYTYRLSGTLDNGANIQSVVWTHTNPENAVRVFTPAGTSGNITDNNVVIQYDPALLNNATIDASGIQLIITATITTTGGSCPNAVYTAEISVRIRDAYCCPGVTINGGVHNEKSNMKIGDYISYNELVPTLGFTRDASKDLCVYYRDGATSVNWNTAKSACENGTYVDAGDRSIGGWRLPNIAELGYMHNLVRSGSGLADQQDADVRTQNFKSKDANGYAYPYWSSTGNNSYFAIAWRFFPSSVDPGLGTWHTDREAIYGGARKNFYSARCVKTVN
ncbi:MAG: DUF1566 domain-containing protein, partial [Dysgonamonadaceae bacterium]|nr:DUF1566 domain-containing protein [Dysgonamonadaceae bacterium]